MDAAPPKIASPKLAPSNARFAAILVAVVAAGVGAVVYFFDPASHNIYPVCQFHQLTGLNCPGCGGTRAAYALLHGHLALAFKDNALFVTGLALALSRGGWFAVNRLRGVPNGKFLPAHITVPLLVVVVVFGVLRNLPAFAFLSP